MLFGKKISNATRTLVLRGFLGICGFATLGCIVHTPAKPELIAKVEQIEEELKSSFNLPLSLEPNTRARCNKLVDEQLEIMTSPEYFKIIENYEDSKEWANYRKDLLFGLSGLSAIPFIFGLKRMYEEKKSR